MTGLLRRAPNLIYILAAIFFVWSIGNSFWELNITHKYADDGDLTVAYMKSKALFQASLDSVFLLTSGIMIDVLIRLLDKFAVKSGEASE